MKLNYTVIDPKIRTYYKSKEKRYCGKK